MFARKARQPKDSTAICTFSVKSEISMHVELDALALHLGDDRAHEVPDEDISVMKTDVFMHSVRAAF